MSCLLKVVVILSVVLSSYSVVLKDCECWKGYEAKEHDGKAKCYGLGGFSSKPCNLPMPPKCACTGDTVTGILINGEGTWCSYSETGRDLERWPCENKEEWAAYKVKYAEYKTNDHK